MMEGGHTEANSASIEYLCINYQMSHGYIHSIYPSNASWMNLLNQSIIKHEFNKQQNGINNMFIYSIAVF